MSSWPSSAVRCPYSHRNRCCARSAPEGFCGDGIARGLSFAVASAGHFSHGFDSAAIGRIVAELAGRSGQETGPPLWTERPLMDPVKPPARARADFRHAKTAKAHPEWKSDQHTS